MPVKSLSTAVLKWPSAETVQRTAKAWATTVGSSDNSVLRIGYFGSYATNDWGVGSDLDIIVILETSEKPFEHRGTRIPPSQIPVPCDVLVYTRSEWEHMLKERRRFARMIQSEAIWLYSR